MEVVGSESSSYLPTMTSIRKPKVNYKGKKKYGRI